MEITATNVNDALYVGMLKFKNYKNKPRMLEIAPRNGEKTVEYFGIWTTNYLKPTERVLFNETRDANPFFHFMEGLWMLAGRRDVDWLAQFNKNIANYSDDGLVFNGAYGHRIRHHFEFDQLKTAISLLQGHPDTRRVVVSLWDANTDLGKYSKDIPCNDMITFKIRNGTLNMRVFNRSNDMIWGAYGANAVHFSMIMEYVAAMVGVPVGIYSHVTDCMHVYLENPKYVELCKPHGITDSLLSDRYNVDIAPYPMVSEPDWWDSDLYNFLMFGVVEAEYKNAFFPDVAVPMLKTYSAYKKSLNKEKVHKSALEEAEMIKASDWRIACMEWLNRRNK